MAHEPVWARQRASRAQAKGAGAPIACIVFVAATGAAFWIGAVWASQSWLAFTR